MRRKINRTGKKILLFILFLGTVTTGQAQIREAVNKILGRDTVAARAAMQEEDTTLLFILNLQKELESIRLKKKNMQAEMEDLRFNLLSADSLKLDKLRIEIDSLRSSTQGSPVVVDNDTLFYLYAKRGGRTPGQRAALTSEAIEKVGKSFGIHPDSVYIEYTDIGSDLMYEDKVLLTLIDKDALWAQTSRESLSQEYRKVIIGKLAKMKEEYSLWRLIKRVFYCLLIVVGQYLLLRATNWLFRRLKERSLRIKGMHISSITIQGYELLNRKRQIRILLFCENILRWVVILLQLLIGVSLIFSIFPQTESFAYRLLGYIWDPIRHILRGVAEYIPNLFTILIIWYAVRKLVQFVYFLANEIESSRINIKGFYPDWAKPTYQIARFLLYAFMIAMIYPHLPGADSGVFQGISVFVGIIVSLGSTTVIGNVIAGFVITYMRPFRNGDFIKLNDRMGKVVEKTPLVTRIRTPKNELITIPNSFVMSSHTVNYSLSAQEYGLIINSEITVGYDVSWRLVEETLISAALETTGVEPEPRPFVLITSLQDWYAAYQINAYVHDADALAAVYSELHKKVQDKFALAGIDIVSPHIYMKVNEGQQVHPSKK